MSAMGWSSCMMRGFGRGEIQREDIIVVGLGWAISRRSGGWGRMRTYPGP